MKTFRSSAEALSPVLWADEWHLNPEPVEAPSRRGGSRDLAEEGHRLLLAVAGGRMTPGEAIRAFEDARDYYDNRTNAGREQWAGIHSGSGGSAGT